MADRRGGAYIDGVRIRTVQDSDLTLRLSGIIGRFMPSDVHAGVMKRAGTFFDPRPGLKCAGAEYPVIALEDRHFAFFWRTLPWDRSEEHKSELQSLMRISYAVFCLKKKKIQKKL